MKLAIAVSLLLAASVAADDFKLNNGTEYKNVRISRIEPDGIMVITKTGIIKLFFSELPKDVQEKYHYDPKKAEAFRFRLDAARDAAAEEVAAANEREHQKSGQITDMRQRPSRSADLSSARRPVNPSALSLDAHEIGTGDGTYNHWYVDWDDYSRGFVRQKRLLITVRDLSRKIPGVTLEVYFIGHPMERDTPLFVYGHAIIPVDLKGDLEVSGTVDAPPLEGHTLRIGAYRTANGSDIDGWIVIGQIDHVPFQVRASRQALLDLARNHPQELAKMAATYESKVRRR